MNGRVFAHRALELEHHQRQAVDIQKTIGYALVNGLVGVAQIQRRQTIEVLDNRFDFARGDVVGLILANQKLAQIVL